MSHRDSTAWIAGLVVVCLAALLAGAYYVKAAGTCAAVKEKGAAAKLAAEAAANRNDLAGQLQHSDTMLKLVDGNRQCFSDEELQRTEVAREILEGFPR